MTESITLPLVHARGVMKVALNQEPSLISSHIQEILK